MNNSKQSFLIVVGDPDILISAGDLFDIVGFNVLKACNCIEAYTYK